MKVLRVLGIIALIAVVACVVLIVSQPDVTRVERSILIQAKPEDIARETESFQSFSAWSPWNKASPEMHYTIVTFEGFGGTFYSDIKLEPEGDATKVTWIYEGHNDNFKDKAMWIMMKNELNDQYEKGLTTLKDIVERKSMERSAPADSVKTQEKGR